jgi:hypothetical protein
MDQVKAGGLRLTGAAERMGLSYRQTKRVWGRYRRGGAAGLVHLSRGRESNRRHDPGFRRKVLAAYEENYKGYAPLLASEHLAEMKNLRVHPETLRRWLLHADLWNSPRKERTHRKRRERRKHFGELVQMDGSHHPWFGERGPEACVMTMIDDATGIRLSWMAEEETTELAFRALALWIGAFGRPHALYTDAKSVFVSDREATEREKRDGLLPMTSFGLACSRLGIKIVTARSPQAKGRVERSHQVLQDRFVKRLRLLGVSDVAGANGLLPAFSRNLSERYAVKAADPADWHRPLLPDMKLDDVLCFEETRTLARDNTISYKTRRFQLPAQRGLPKPGSRVAVRRRMNGSLLMLPAAQKSGEEPLVFEELPTPPERLAWAPQVSTPLLAKLERRVGNKSHRPAPDHPWRQSFLKSKEQTTQVMRNSNHGKPTNKPTSLSLSGMNAAGKQPAPSPERNEGGAPGPAPASNPPTRRSGRSPAEPYPHRAKPFSHNRPQPSTGIKREKVPHPSTLIEGGGVGYLFLFFGNGVYRGMTGCHSQKALNS